MQPKKGAGNKKSRKSKTNNSESVGFGLAYLFCKAKNRAHRKPYRYTLSTLDLATHPFVSLWKNCLRNESSFLCPRSRPWPKVVGHSLCTPLFRSISHSCRPQTPLQPDPITPPYPSCGSALGPRIHHADPRKIEKYTRLVEGSTRQKSCSPLARFEIIKTSISLFAHSSTTPMSIWWSSEVFLHTKTSR